MPIATVAYDPTRLPIAPSSAVAAPLSHTPSVFTPRIAWPVGHTPVTRACATVPTTPGARLAAVIGASGDLRGGDRARCQHGGGNGRRRPRIATAVRTEREGAGVAGAVGPRAAERGDADARVHLEAASAGHGHDVQAEPDRPVGIGGERADERRPLRGAALISSKPSAV